MAEPEVRRSGRQRTVSTRLKDMVTTKTARGKQNDNDVVTQDENPNPAKKKALPREAIDSPNSKITIEKMQNEETECQKKMLSTSEQNCEVSKQNEGLDEVPMTECDQLKGSKTKEVSDGDVTNSGTDKVPLNSPDYSRNEEYLDCLKSHDMADNSCPDNNAIKVVQSDGDDGKAETSEITVIKAIKPISEDINCPTAEKNSHVERSVATPTAPVVSASLLEIGAIKNTKTVNVTTNNAESEQTVLKEPSTLGTASSSTGTQAEKDTRQPEQPSNETKASDDPASESTDVADTLSKVVTVLSSTCNIADFPGATVTQNEKGELLLSFGDLDEEPDSSRTPAVIPRVTSAGLECTVDGCHYMTTRRVNWYKHQRVHTGTKAHPCDKCPYVAKTTSNLKRHQMIHTNVKQYVCHFCEDTFRQKIHLKRHIRYKHESKRVQCAYCDYRCANVNPDLRIHMRRRHLIHINEEAARVLCSCTECGFVAPSKKDLAQHMKFHRPGPELKLFCEYCSFVTDCSSRLSRHILIHTKERPYQCGLCDYRASQKQHVIRHMRTKHCVEAEKIITPHRKNKDSDVPQLYEDNSGSAENNESTSELLNSTTVQTNQVDSDLNQNKEVSSSLQLDISESIIPHTADIIRDGLRVLMDESDDNAMEIMEEKPSEGENTSDTENSTGNFESTPHNVCVETASDNDLSKENQAESDEMPKAGEPTPASETKMSCSPMVSLFQPSELSKDKIYPCTYCTMKFSKTLNLYKHLELQHKVIQSLSCCLCDYKTDRKANLLIHLRKHNMPRKQHRSLIDVASQRAGKSLLFSNPSSAKQAKSLLKTMRVYNCVLCRQSDSNLQNLFKHIEQKHADMLNSSGGQEPGAFCVVQDVPSKPNNAVGSKDSDSGFQRVMVEMWPGSPAQPVDIEQPWHQDVTQVTNSSVELIQGLQALANQASNSNALTAAELQAVCGSNQDKLNNIQVPAEQLMNLSSGDYIEIDGEMYKVEFSD